MMKESYLSSILSVKDCGTNSASSKGIIKKRLLLKK